MKLYLSFVVIAVLCVTLNLQAQEDFSSLTNKQKSVAQASNALTHFSATAANNRVTLQWTISKNAETDRFEVEKSIDGEKFFMTALVFGSELSGDANYEFFEKLKKTKSHYRLKIIYKDGRVDYSSIIVPATQTSSI